MVTSVGFGMLECVEYITAVRKLKPDIVLGLGDVLHGHQAGVKRVERMADRTQSWLNALISGINSSDYGNSQTAVFAPILPIDAEKQSWYLGAVRDDFAADISGFSLYENDSITAIPQELSNLPRLYMGDLRTPHQLLDSIDACMDILTIPFINESTDAGFAFDFSFGKAQSASSPGMKRPLAVDMWSSEHATNLSPLRPDCCCYTCTHHHRAYVQHLLKTNEMLSWVLLQLHNYHVIGELFESVRSTIAKGEFEDARKDFESMYERDWPTKTGTGPRTRGYQIRSIGNGPPKQNKAPYRSLNDGREKLRDGAPRNPKTTAIDLEEAGFAEMFDEEARIERDA